jgi:DNA-binding NarL/FixJ family response regulator
MEGHLQRAIQMAADQGCPAARAESLGRLSLEASRLGTGPNDGALLTLATDSAREVLGLTPVLPGKAPWGAEAHAALARVAMAGGDLKQAVDEARAAVADLRSMMSEDLLLDVRLPAAEVFMRAGDENEREELIGGLRLTLTFLLQQIEDDRVRVRWLRSPTGRKLTEVAGQVEPQLATAPGKSPEAARFNDQESRLLRLLIDARTNAEIADELGLTVDQVAHALIALYARIGATTRAQATSNALMGKLV